MSQKYPHYVNLHLHTEYSALDGFARFEDVKDGDRVVMQGITSRLVDIGHTACATTDHASLSAIYPAYNSFKNAKKKVGDKEEPYKIKFLPGIEFYIVNDRSIARGQMNNHLVCIARNEQGWKNLLKLNFEGYRTGATTIYDRVVPRIDLDALEGHTDGLVAASACLAGVPPQLLKNGEYDQAEWYVKKMVEMFRDKKTGQNCYFLEVQCVDFYRMLDEHAKTSFFDKRWIERQARDQKEVNDKIIALASKLKVPVVCTTDAHYVSKADRDAHLLLLAIQSKTTIDSPAEGKGGRLAFEATAMLSSEELVKAFSEKESGFNGYDEAQVVEWIKNTQLAADLVEEPKYLEPEGYELPEYPVKEADDFEAFLKWKNSLEQEQVDQLIQATEKK